MFRDPARLRQIRVLVLVFSSILFLSDGPLPIASLRLLAPPLRLVSAAMWKVMQERDAMHYGKLEEFVTSVSETVPGLLSYRHQAKLSVGLRARVSIKMSIMKFRDTKLHSSVFVLDFGCFS